MNKQKDKTWIAGVLLALTASLCCLTPVLALLSGVGGIAATFSFLEPARPYLISITALVLGFAWYQKLKPRKKEEIECDCEEDGKTSFWQSKRFLGIVTILAIGLLAFPSYSHIFYAKNEKALTGTNDPVPAIVKFSVSGMTCTSCEEHIKHAANGVEGVLESSANYKAGTVSVKFDKSKVSVDKIADAINATGYKVDKHETVRDNAAMPLFPQADSVGKIELNVKGMTCSGCEEHVRHAVNELDGILRASASYKDGKAIIHYDVKKTSPEQIKAAINGTGYKVVDPE
jgi:mercuric ion transport protein